jgi:hypothetical protein
MSAFVRSSGGAAGEVARGDFPRTQIFHVNEPEPGQLVAKFVRREKVDPRFAQFGHVCGAAFVHGAHFRGQRFRRIAVIEYHVRAIG